MAAASPPLLPSPHYRGRGRHASPLPLPVPANHRRRLGRHPAAARASLSRLLDSARRALSGARPWSELADRSALSRPDSLADAASRLRKNLAYFRVNYAAAVALSLAASLLAHPFSLAALVALLAAWCLLYVLRPADAQPLAACGRAFSDREVLGGSSPPSSPASAPSSSPRSRSVPPSSAPTERAACPKTCSLIAAATGGRV
jgi:PRA1 family protein 1